MRYEQLSKVKKKLFGDLGANGSRLRGLDELKTFKLQYNLFTHKRMFLDIRVINKYTVDKKASKTVQIQLLYMEKACAILSLTSTWGIISTEMGRAETIQRKKSNLRNEKVSWHL